jgi:multiple sugar transport system permease protein
MRILSQFQGKGVEAREARLGVTLLSPTALIVFGLVIFPAIFSIWVSFHQVTLGNLDDVFNAQFVGLDNYRKVFTDFAFKYQNFKVWGAAVTSVVYSLAPRF